MCLYISIDIYIYIYIYIFYSDQLPVHSEDVKDVDKPNNQGELEPDLSPPDMEEPQLPNEKGAIPAQPNYA